MNDPRTHKTSIGRSLWNRIADGWVADVPEDIACCEFDCWKLRCTRQQWATCGHRLREMAVVEADESKQRPPDWRMSRAANPPPRTELAAATTHFGPQQLIDDEVVRQT
jgi:hypothetical protein